MTPQPILKKIQEAKGKQLKNLSLRESGLTEIPMGVFELEQLEQLDLTDNKIKIIPEEIRKLKNLEWIDLDKNPLEKIHDIPGLCLDYEQYKKFRHVLTKENIYGLFIRNQKSFPHDVTELEKLSLLEIKNMDGFSEQILKYKYLISIQITECQIKEIPSHISTLINLTSLNLSGTQIKEIPSHITSLINLTFLNLSRTQIKEIPSHITCLINLAFLDFSDTQIKEIPSHITSLINLTFLDFSYTQIKEIPSHITSLINLTSLSLSGTQIKEIPSHITSLINLTSLNLSRNQIKEIPLHISMLINLTSLNLSGTQIKEIPSHITSLINLTSLNLSDTQIKEIPSHITSLINLTSLNLSRTQIKEIPSHITSLINLTSLDLSGTRIKEIPSHITSLINLTSLNLSRTQIKEIPSHITSLINLTSLNLSDTQIKEIPSHITSLINLTSLNLSGTRIKEIPSHITSLINLTSLNLSGTQIKEIPSHITSLINLTSLNLSRTQIKEIPSHITSLINLTSLDLSGTQIKEIPSHITSLINLTSLNLSGTRIKEIPSHITSLINLTSLNLSGTQIKEIPSHISTLINLTSLNLSGTQIKEIPSHITSLINLTSLSLSGTQIKEIPSHITSLINLTSLSLSGTQIKEIPEHITSLINLTFLDFSDTQIKEIPSHITSLINLTSLYLSHTQIKEIPSHITSLINLTSLNLSDTQIKEIPSHISTLINLTSLNLSDTQIKEIPSHISTLINLTSLNLSGTQIKEIPEHITSLINLTFLNLSDTQIKEIPSHISTLINLTFLNLSRNQIKEIPSHISTLINLTSLYLSGTQIKEIPEHIIKLENLTFLSLRSNQIKEIPEHIIKLENLTFLSLRSNQIKEIPEHIIKLENLTSLDLSENPIIFPLNVICDRGIDSIRSFFEEYNKGKKVFYEGKVILIGNGRVGKTCLTKRIMNKGFNPEEITTHETEIHSYDKILIRDENNEEHPLILNFWDMGGQKLYHATHRFFFSEKALYLLVWDKVTSEKAKNNPENGIDFLYDYWLDMAHNLGKASPVIMVQSQVEKPEQIIYPDDLNQLKEEYNVLDSLHFGAQTPFRLDRVESAIKEAFRENEKLSNSVKICLPESWFYLKKELQAFAKSGIHYISLEKFIEHCKRNKISESAHGTLLKYLHDIGSVLYFGDLEQLKDMVIINPLWIINIVYKILDRELEWRKGQFDKAYIREKLKPKEKEDLDLSDKEIDKFLEMLIKFEVCFKEPGSEDKYIASQFLTKERIIGLDQLWKEKSLLFLKYPKYINENIMIRLISRFGEKADLKNYWNNGILFTSHHSQSLIEAFHNLKEIQISFTENHSELFHEVVKSLREVHRNIGVNLYIRCLCSKCQTSNEPNQFLYEQLIEELDRGKQIQCPKSHELVNRSNYSIYLPIKKEDIVSDKDISIQSQIHKEIYEETKLVTKEKKPNKKSKSKKKILFISFQSIETKKINAEDECNFIKNLLNTKPSFTLIDELSTPKDKLAIFLKKYQPDILHITSHSDSEKGLLATDKLKKEVEIPPEKLARIINDTNKLNKHTMELVILNACNSAEHAKILSRAETINCAIGINNFILDGDAIKFTELFYESFIIENNSFEVALEIGNIAIDSEDNKRYIFYTKENNQ